VLSGPYCWGELSRLELLDHFKKFVVFLKFNQLFGLGEQFINLNAQELILKLLVKVGDLLSEDSF
jgi:hypothetical protein